MAHEDFYWKTGGSLPLFRVKRGDVGTDPLITPAAVGKWCFILRGELYGFYPTPDAARAVLRRRETLDEAAYRRRTEPR